MSSNTNFLKIDAPKRCTMKKCDTCNKNINGKIIENE